MCNFKYFRFNDLKFNIFFILFSSGLNVFNFVYFIISKHLQWCY